METDHRKAVDQLFHAILSLNDLDECYAFFEDAFTIRELQEISQRYDVAEKLWHGKSYNEINKETGASTATICRVKKCLTCDNSGYKLVLDRLHKQEARTE